MPVAIGTTKTTYRTGNLGKERGFETARFPGPQEGPRHPPPPEALQDPQHAAVLLEQSLTAIERAKETMAKAPELKPTGRPPKGGDKVVSDTTLGRAKTGVSKDRLAAKLKRDHPEIAARVANGEFKSIRAAALEAGIRKPMRSIPVDTPPEALQAPWAHRPGWQYQRKAQALPARRGGAWRGSFSL